MILSASRTLPQVFAFMFADILSIDAGYLTGQDNYRATDYSEYLEIMKSRAEYDILFDNYTKYDTLLDQFGYRKVCVVQDSDHSRFYLRHRGQTAGIPEEELDRLIEDVTRYIKKKLSIIMEEWRTPELDHIDFDTIDLDEIVQNNPDAVRKLTKD